MDLEKRQGAVQEELRKRKDKENYEAKIYPLRREDSGDNHRGETYRKEDLYLTTESQVWRGAKKGQDIRPVIRPK